MTTLSSKIDTNGETFRANAAHNRALVERLNDTYVAFDADQQASRGAAADTA